MGPLTAGIWQATRRRLLALASPLCLLAPRLCHSGQLGSDGRVSLRRLTGLPRWKLRPRWSWVRTRLGGMVLLLLLAVCW